MLELTSRSPSTSPSLALLTDSGPADQNVRPPDSVVTWGTAVGSPNRSRQGRVDVLWAAGGGAFTMSWTERDGPPVSAPERRGFGTTVMERMVEGSLGDKVDLDYAPSDLTWHLTCPAESTLEPRGRSSSAWDRTILLECLSKSRRHVATGEQHIDRQRQLIAELERDGHDSQEAKRLLALFEELQRMHIAGLDRLEKELAEISK